MSIQPNVVPTQYVADAMRLSRQRGFVPAQFRDAGITTVITDTLEFSTGNGKFWTVATMADDAYCPECDASFNSDDVAGAGNCPNCGSRLSAL